MFSQFRQAVETLAQPLAQENTSSADARSQSPDSLRQSSTQFADNTLSNLRKSIAAQRAVNPTHHNPRARSASPSSSGRSASDSGLRKTTLEERLRASFASSESLGGSTPNLAASNPSTPSSRPVPVIEHPLSPTSTPPPPDTPSPPTGSASAAADTPAEVPKDSHDASAPSQESDDVPSNETPPSTDSRALDNPADMSVADNVQIESTTDPSMPAQGITDTEPRPNVQPSVQASDTLPIAADPPAEESAEAEPQPTTTDVSSDAGIQALQERLKLVEQKFADVSTSFKKLQAERQEVDSIISELTPVESSNDVAALREYLVSVNMKVESGQDELQRLNGKLTRQEERLEELQNTHRLESASHSDQIERLRKQLSEAEALIAASQSTASQTDQANAIQTSEIESLRADVSKANELAKEEEEKRVKAITLLKTVRQKLVKAEKERDDASRELNEARERNMEEKEKDRAERASLERRIDVANAEREKSIVELRAQFDQDIALAKEHAERDMQAARKQFEIETSTLKASHSIEISSQKSRISTLENSVAKLSGENRSFFEQLELRQAELESSQCHAESLQAQNTELQFQLKESQERIALLDDEVGELQGEHEMRSQVTSASAEEISQIVSSVELKYETKLSELKKTITTVEKERTEAEANWSRKLTEKTKETEELKYMLQSSTQLHERDEGATEALKAEIEKLQTETRSQQGRLYELQTHLDAFKDAEAALQRRLSETAARGDDSEKQFEESKSREVQLRSQNKTLRDELRKVQNSVAILEKQRHPGAGYWTFRSEATDSRTSISSIPDAPSSSSLPVTKSEEDINYEYLRNVIIQFLEHKEMRPNLVRVLSTILRFTPQETRRLMSKV